ncbi:MAG: polysaccharide biosynthesis tyrosine autokinase [Phycisphaerales bacterium]|nr:MAG: polysaccharide biosynthesis tyrosine autokinase [Phycisphaerales bacterium]
MAQDRPVGSNRRPRSAGPRSAATASLSPREVLAILRRHIFLIFFLTLFALAAGGGIWKLLQIKFPRYTARTYIQVLPPVETDPMTIGTVQLQRDVLYGHRQSIANLIKQQSTIEELLKRDAVKETSWYNGFRGTPARKDRKRVKYLKKHFGAYAHRDSDFVEISMSCGGAQEAADIVNEMLHLFLARQGVSEQREIADRMRELEERRDAVQKEYNAAEDDLDDVRARFELTDLERPLGRNFQHTITVRLNSLELQRDELALLIGQLEADLGNLEQLATGPVTEQIESAIENDPTMTALAQQLAFQEAELSGKLSRFGEGHRDVRRLRDSIEKTRQEREKRKAELAEQTTRANLENAQDTLVVLRGRYEALEASRQEAEAEKKQLDLARVQYDKALKVRDERLARLDEIKAQIEKLKIMHDDPKTPKVLSVGDAPRPLEMVFSRQWWLWFPSGTTLGLLLGIGLAFLVELANDLVRTPRDVDRFVSIPLLGVIPNASEDRQARRVNLAHVVRQAPYSITSEAYRRCRANLRLSGSADSLGTLLVTSGMTGDGKTLVVANLAASFVASGKNVLLIDANFRKPDLHKLFPKGAAEDSAEHFDYGLSSVLTHQCASGEAVRSSGIEGLDIVDCGPSPANPAELLGSSRMEELLREQRRNYDYVIIDGPPVLLVSDAKVLAGLVDATVLVFNGDATARGAAQRTVRELRQVDAKVIGCVLFGARSIKGGYFQEQFKSYKKYHKSAQLVGSTA